MNVDWRGKQADGSARDLETARAVSWKIIEAWRQQGDPGALDVLQAYPALAGCPQAMVDLAYEEYCLRVESGEVLDWRGFCQEFPDIQDSLERRIAVHLALEEKSLHDHVPEESTWPRVGSVFFGYQIVAEIGRGSFARVYRAEEVFVGRRPVVIKVCHQQTQEPHILGKLQHENIIPIHSVQELPSGMTVICMPFLGMFTLHDMLATTFRITRPSARDVVDQDGKMVGDDWLSVTYVNDVLEIGRQLCDALHYLHGKDMLHLDLKPANILMDDAQRPIILDFNLSYDAGGLPGQAGGTFGYMSPEQRQVVLAGRGYVKDLDARTDVFSVGVILFELFNGVLPFVNNRQGQTDFPCHRASRIPWRYQGRMITRGIKCVIDKAIQEDPMQRYATAEEFSQALQQQLKGFRRGVRLLRGDMGFLRTVAVSSALVVTVVVSFVYVAELYRMFSW